MGQYEVVCGLSGQCVDTVFTTPPAETENEKPWRVIFDRPREGWYIVFRVNDTEECEHGPYSDLQEAVRIAKWMYCEIDVI